MLNQITITNDAFYNNVVEQGSDSVIVTFTGVSTDASLEVYQGNEFYKLISCKVIDGNASATLPSEIFTGSNVHFRLYTASGYSQFYHIVYDPEKAFTFNIYNYVLCGNKFEVNSNNLILDGYAYMTYGELAAFTHDSLAAFTYNQIRKKEII